MSNQKKGINLQEFLAKRGANLIAKKVNEKQPNKSTNNKGVDKKAMPLVGSNKQEKKIAKIGQKKAKESKSEQKTAKVSTPKTPKLEPSSLFKFIDTKLVRDPIKLFSFIKWLAVPAQEREIKTQGELAKIMGINEGTLGDWKQLTGFWDEVAIHRTQYFRKFTSTVYFGLKERAKKGDPKAVELYASLFEGYKQKIGYTNETPEDVTTKEVDLINEALKKIGLASLNEFNNAFEKNEL